MEARVTSQSQLFRLRERMEEANVSHQQELRADLPNVRVTAIAGTGDAQVLFCNLGPIRVRDVVSSGDNGPLPTWVAVHGLEVPMAGTYDICNVRLSSNGDIELAVDDRTYIVPAVAPAPEAMYQVVAS